MGISDFKGIANMTPEERGELWNKMVNYRGAFLPPTNYPAKPAANASAGNTSFNYGSRIDQATMSPGGAPDTVSNAVLPAPRFAPQAPIKAMTPPAPTSGPTNTAANFAPPSSLQTDPNGYAIVDGKRINYADIGGKNDPLRKGGGIVTNGSTPTFAPPDPNVGLANQDAQDRQAAGQRAVTTGDLDVRPPRGDRSARRRHPRHPGQRNPVDPPLDVRRHQITPAAAAYWRALAIVTEVGSATGFTVVMLIAAAPAFAPIACACSSAAASFP
jgi:hypothetical protein